MADTEKKDLNSGGHVEIALTDINPQDDGVPPVKISEQAQASRLPVLFERAAGSWWNPRFDTDILEDQHRRSMLPLSMGRFRFALGYVILSCAVWCVFFGVRHSAIEKWVAYVSGTAVLLVLMVVILGFSYSTVFVRCVLPMAVVVSLLLCMFNLLGYAYADTPGLSVVGTFTGSIEILIMIYTLIPLPLYVCLLIGVIYSALFEILYATLMDQATPVYIACRVLLHICIHLIGTHVYLMSEVRKHSTFLKVGQSTVARRELEGEKQQKQNMIHSLMPAKVADEVMKARGGEGNNEDDMGGPKRSSKSGSGTPEKGLIVFRKFHMSQIDNVTILFADIVGFTKMSSNKSAETLVGLLNDLFGRFDKICQRTNCEKISTLGDCYYCVSGCPEPREDHARCCVEMGRAMCVAIKEFDEEHNEEVNMRVGVHTGTVLCGLVGTRRFKFDVWSHDVTMANIMESEGKPGRVHVSDMTYRFIKDMYEFEPGEEVDDLRNKKVLVENYNTETQQYRVMHVTEENKIKTWFIVEPDQGEVVADSHHVTTDNQSALSNNKDVEKGPEELQQDQGDNKDQANVGLLSNKEKEAPSKTDEFNGELVSNPGSAVQQQQGYNKLSGVEKDKQMVKLMTEYSADVDKYLYHPPINAFTVNFSSSDLERKYRTSYQSDAERNAVKTFSMPRVSSVVDVIVSLIFYLIIMACCLLAFQGSIRTIWVVTFSVGLIIHLCVLVPMLCDVCGCCVNNAALTRVLRGALGSWYPRHAVGAIISSLPTLVVYSTFCCIMFLELGDSNIFFCIFVVTSLLHYSIFTGLASWMKSALAIIAGIVLIILLGVGVCPHAPISPCNENTTCPPDMTTQSFTEPRVFSGDHDLKYEIIVDILLFIILLWYLNREIEISYRLCYHGDSQAARDRTKIKQEKEQADWLLHNIVPEHVANMLKNTGTYCKNHKNVGVIFAKVANFDDFYDESYEGGKEYLRVLNELLGDFEDLFDLPKYRDIEKIKTIGSCLMAASGLNPTVHLNKDPNAHLYALMDFSLDILKKMEQFNAEIFNFDFEVCIGYNVGEVTAGVIGTTKLLYDIWGDAVNISSRMYSTGEHHRIQVTEDVAKQLGDKFEFEYRGKTFVKGKGDMSTYLLVRKKPGATWE